MADVHQIITMHGIEEARRQALTKRERQSVETAYQVLTDDAVRLGFTYSGFARAIAFGFLASKQLLQRSIFRSGSELSA